MFKHISEAKLLSIVSLSMLIASCNLDKIDPIAAAPKPKASFQLTANNCQAPCDPGFKNLSTNAASYTWDFGDGATATDAEPKHTYANAGTFSVKLTARNANNVADDTTISVTIAQKQVAPVADFSFTIAANTFAPVNVTFTNKSTNAATYAWEFGDGGTSTVASPIYQFKKGGIFDVKLTATGPGGTNAKTQSVTINVVTFQKNYAANGLFTAVEIVDDGYIIGGTSAGLVSVFKMDLLGAIKAFKTFNYSNLPIVRTIGKTATSGYYIGGGYDNGNFSHKPFFIGVDNNLTQTFAQTYKFTPCSEIYDAAISSNGGFMLGGFVGDCDQGTYDGLLVKVNTGGVQTTTNTIVSLSHIKTIFPQKDGYILFTGGESDGGQSYLKVDLTGSLIWQKTAASLPIHAAIAVRDGFIVAGGYQKAIFLRLDSNGDAVGSRKEIPIAGGPFSVPSGHALTEASDGGYVLVMSSTSALKLIKVDVNFNLIWERTFSGKFNGGGTFDHYMVKEALDGGYAIVGVSYDPGSTVNSYIQTFIKTDSQGRVN